MDLKDYDFANRPKIPNWGQAYYELGSVRIAGHPVICALYHISQGFTRSHYISRQEARASFYDQHGNHRTLPHIEIHDMMALDMDTILTAIHTDLNPVPTNIIMHTNDTEHKDWLWLMDRCPYARKIYNIPSRMGKYTVTGWMVSKEDYR